MAIGCLRWSGSMTTMIHRIPLVVGFFEAGWGRIPDKIKSRVWSSIKINYNWTWHANASFQCPDPTFASTMLPLGLFRFVQVNCFYLYLIKKFNCTMLNVWSILNRWLIVCVYNIELFLLWSSFIRANVRSMRMWIKCYNFSKNSTLFDPIGITWWQKKKKNLRTAARNVRAATFDLTEQCHSRVTFVSFLRIANDTSYFSLVSHSYISFFSFLL